MHHGIEDSLTAGAILEHLCESTTLAEMLDLARDESGGISYEKAANEPIGDGLASFLVVETFETTEGIDDLWEAVVCAKSSIKRAARDLAEAEELLESLAATLRGADSHARVTKYDDSAGGTSSSFLVRIQSSLYLLTLPKKIHPHRVVLEMALMAADCPQHATPQETEDLVRAWWLPILMGTDGCSSTDINCSYRGRA